MERQITATKKLTWVENNNELLPLEFKVGQLFDCETHPLLKRRTLKVIAIAEKYVFVRFKGCIPFAKSQNEFGRYLESINAYLVGWK